VKSSAFRLPPSAFASPRGMTLVELLVVLAILALLTTVAVTSTDVLMGQGRYEATQRTLAEIRRAVIDDGSLGGGNSGTLAGFVVDMGRPPTSLDELLAAPTRFALHRVWGFDSAGDGIDVQLAGGWHGPYVRLGPGQEALRDGWGRDLVFELTGGGVLTIFSKGADGDSELPEDGYNRNLGVQIAPDDYLASPLTFHVRELGDSGNAQDPQLAAGEQVKLRFYHVAPSTGEVVLEEVNLPTFQYRVEGFPGGTVAARGLVTGGATVRMSPVCYVTIRPRSTCYQKLILPRVLSSTGD